MIFKIAIIGIITTVLTVIVKQYKPELSIFVPIAGSIVLLGFIESPLSNLFSFFNNIMASTGININIVSPVLKVVGIGYLTEFSAGICEDFGNKTIANKMVFAGKIAIITVGLPIIKTLVETIVSII